MSNEASILCLFYMLLVVFLFYLSFSQVASRQVDVPTEFIRSILCSDVIVKIMLHIYPLFLFWFWYSSCFDVKCWFHTFPNRYSHISMGVLVLLGHQDLLVYPFQPVCFLFKLFHTDVVEKSDDLSVSFTPSCLCFPHPPILLLLGVRNSQMKYPFYSCDISSFFSFNVLIRCFIVNMLKSFKLIILLFSNSVGGYNSRFRCWSYPFPHFTMLSYSSAPINHSPLPIHIWSAEDS